jgi:hypothetical protein
MEQPTGRDSVFRSALLMHVTLLLGFATAYAAIEAFMRPAIEDDDVRSDAEAQKPKADARLSRVLKSVYLSCVITMGVTPPERALLPDSRFGLMTVLVHVCLSLAIKLYVVLER